MNIEKSTLQYGWISALSLVIFTLVTWGLAMIAVPPAGPYCPGDCMEYPFRDLLSWYPRDYYWMYLAVFQLFAFIMFLIANHYAVGKEHKAFSFTGLSFGLISAIVLLVAYYLQFAVVPISMMKEETEGIALLTQYNGHGIFIAMEELGYICMSISFLFLGFSFSVKIPGERAIRWVLQAAFPLTILAFLIYTLKYGIDRSYRFEVAAISINWIVCIVGGILLTIHFRKKIKSQHSSS
jgi:hypothetical protein